MHRGCRPPGAGSFFHEWGERDGKIQSDIHGSYDEFEELLQVAGYNPDRERLVLLGDYIDRGPKSCEVVARVMELVQAYGAIALGGNHEDILLGWLDGQERMAKIFANEHTGGGATLRSYCAGHGDWEQDDQARAILNEVFADHIAFLRALPDYHETEHHVFVHAGINPFAEDWKQSTRAELRWIREPFHKNPHPHAQTFVFGHTPTGYLHGDENCHEVWHGEKIIGIDGGGAYGHQLNCLEISEDGYHAYTVKKR